MRAFSSLSELIMISGDKGVSNYYRKKDSTLVFRSKAYVGVVALFILLLTLAIIIVDAEDPSKLTGKLVLGTIFGFLGVYLLLLYIITKVYIGTESITLRNALGMRRSIRWDDLKAVYKASQESAIKVCSEKNEIMINSYFKGVPLIKALLEKFCPEAFNIESLLGSAVIPGNYRKNNGALVFRVKKLVAVFIIFYIVIALGPILSPVEKFVPLWGSQLASKLAVIAFPAIPVSLILLYCLSLKASIDTEKIEYKSIIGKKKEIFWKDVVCCETFVRSRNLHLRVCSHDQKIVLSGLFSGFELMMDVIKKYCPEKDPSTKGKSKKQSRK